MGAVQAAQEATAMSGWNMPPGVTTNDIPGNDDDIECPDCGDVFPLNDAKCPDCGWHNVDSPNYDPTPADGPLGGYDSYPEPLTKDQIRRGEGL